MLSTLTGTLSRLSLKSCAVAGPSRSAIAQHTSPLPCLLASSKSAPGPTGGALGVRHASQLAPRRTKYRKAHKGRIPFPTGGSLKGTTLSEGAYGIRVLEPVRLSAKQLQSAENALKRKLKVIKGAQVFMRVFPDIPVCVKGNETRMGKGKGTFEFWACRAPVGRVIFELGGPVDIRPEVAKDALRLAAAKLPVKSEFITRESAPRLGRLTLTSVPPSSAAARGGSGIVATEPFTPSSPSAVQSVQGTQSEAAGTSSTTA